MAMNDDLCWLSIDEASTLLRNGETSSVELTRAVLDRIDATEPSVHAYAGVMRESALEGAERADAELEALGPRGPLHGIPVAVKDLCFTAGFPTEAGSRVLKGFVPSYNAAVVDKLLEAGAVIVGKTVTHEFAYGQDVPPTRNAWDHACYPGGSSAGSAVAVAIGSAFGAVGTDTGGSIRVPASVNGVVGLKPTHDRVSRHGVFPMSPTLDSVGPLTRTVEDCALMLGAMAGPSGPRDVLALDEPVPSYTAGLSRRLDGVTIGVDRRYFFYDAVSDDVRKCVDDALALVTQLGATIVEVVIEELDLSVSAGMSVLLGDTSEWHQRLLRYSGDAYVRETRVMLELGELVPATAYVRSQRARRLVQQAVRRTFEENGLDALAAPTLPLTTMPVEQLSVDLTGSGETALSTFIHHCFLANVVGIPSLSIPVGFSREALPVGMQLFGRPFGEPALFRIGHAYQAETDWHQQHPNLTEASASALT
jgi:Asp-tRNA(Asn)/Glu-tRNA(Gln) amidotransferase A subunit family amidase